MLLLSLVSLLSLGMTDVIIFHLRQDLGQGRQVVGAVLALAGAGTMLAAAGTPRLRRVLGFGPCWLGSYLICGGCVALLGGSRSAAWVAVLVLGYTFGMGVAGISSMSLRQSITPDHLLGRVTSAFWTAHTALAPAGAALLTVLVGRYGTRTPLLAIGALFAAVVTVGLFTAIRQRHPERAENEAPASTADASPEFRP
jgi:MFS family permease